MLIYRNPERNRLKRYSAMPCVPPWSSGHLFGPGIRIFCTKDNQDILHKVDIGVVAVFILYVLSICCCRNKQNYARQYWLEITLVSLFFLQLAATQFAGPVLMRNIFNALHITT